MRKQILAVATCGLTMCLAAMPTGRAQIRDDLAPVSLGTSAMRHDLPVTLQVFPSDKPASGHEPLTVRAMNRADRTVVSCGVLVLRRDRHARPRPQTRLVMRPRYGLAPGRTETLSLPVVGTSSELELRPTFALFTDGSWAGNASQAREEIEGRREAYRAARAIAVDLAALPALPQREALVRLAGRFSQGLARAVTEDGRAEYGAALRTLAAALDERTRRGRAYTDTVAIVQRRVDRVLDDSARLPFVVGHIIRE